jgi:cytochrome c1
MPAPLSEGQVTYADGTPASVEQMSRDVTAFLTWAAEPALEPRHRMGLKVMVFLISLTVLMYFAKRKIWADVH